ncbi:MAG: DUF1015 domain-containing protein, partial [Hyphomicrobiales bacterium]|nr:DUF1015 domain-containing protein [Hyphomicrobiales bacterium]
MSAPILKPFAALRPAPGRAADVVAPPYDVLSSEEARARAHGRPWSFLHVSMAEIDLEPGIDHYAPQVYAKAAENLNRMVAEGVLVRDPAPRFYVYRVARNGHVQTGIVGAASVAEYARNRIRRHEFTKPVKEDDRVRQIDATNAQTGPVFVTHRADPEVAAVIAAATAGEPAADVTADDGVRHAVWVVEDAALIDRLAAAFQGMDALYIADGHHRSAAAARVAAARREEAGARGGDRGGDGDGEASHDRFLVVSFPDDEVRILDYNRVVRDLNGLTRGSFLARVSEVFAITESAGPARPQEPHAFGMYLAGKWYCLAPRASLPADPVGRLDISLLSDRLLTPILGVGDPRTDPRIDFVGGTRGLAALENRVDSGQWAVAFALYPTSLEDLMA